jgi:hypothetical protein
MSFEDELEEDHYHFRATLHLLTLVDADGTRHKDTYVPRYTDYNRNWVFLKNGKYYKFDTVNETPIGDDHVFTEVTKEDAGKVENSVIIELTQENA